MIEEWADDRLMVSGLGPDLIITQPDKIKKFWTPEMYFINALSATIVNGFQTVQKLTISSDGMVKFAQRIHGVFSCVMNLRNFPHDYQYCHFKLSSRKYMKLH